MQPRIPKHRDGQRRQALIVIAATTVGAAAVVVALTDASQWDHAFDFRLMWLAGVTWLNGYSPYAPEFDALYAAHFGGSQAAWHVFNYPPYFSLVALAQGALPYATSATLWLVLNVACITAAAAVMGFSVLKPYTQRHTLVFLGLVAFTLTHYAGGYSLFYGQSSLFMLLGATLFILGFSHKRAGPLSAALILLSLKPNVGLFSGFLVLACAYDLRARQWQSWAITPVLAAAAFVFAGSLLAVAIGGMEPTLVGFAERIKSYSAGEPSAVYSLTGLPYLVDTAVRVHVPLVLTLALGATCCLILVKNTSDRTIAACGVFAASVFFVPLHTYDLIVTVALVPLLWCLPPRRAVLAAVALLAVHQCNNLALQINPRSWHDDGLLPATVGVLVLLLVCVQPWPRGAALQQEAR